MVNQYHDLQYTSGILFAIIGWCLYKLLFKNWSYFSDRNVKFLRGMPMLGINYPILKGKVSMVETLQEIYSKFPDEQIVGVYDTFNQPMYFVRDPDLIKQITTKDFDHFVNRRFTIDEAADPLMSKSIFFMTNQTWKDMRATLSPAFTGSKMRLMFSLMTDFEQKFIKTLQTNGKNESKVYEIKDLFTRFASDIIGTCAFGLEVNSLKDRENDFYKTGQTITNFGGIQLLKILIFNNIPWLMRWFKMTITSKEHISYFRNLVMGTISFREKNNVIRHDMINLIMQARKGNYDSTNETVNLKDTGFSTVEEYSSVPNKLRKWPDDYLVAQCLGFFIAGFDTVSTFLCFTVHELAINQDIQEKLYREIVDTDKHLDSHQLTYEAANKMKYLDMVVSESLRKWSPSNATDRKVSKPITLNLHNGHKLNLNIGDILSIPAYCLHRDGSYFPDPERFDPERFNEQNAGKVRLGTYMPFGLGPRNCIGSRFALMECKSFLYYFLKTFKLNKCDRTQDPLKLQTKTFNMNAEKGFWIELVPRG